MYGKRINPLFKGHPLAHAHTPLQTRMPHVARVAACLFLGAGFVYLPYYALYFPVFCISICHPFDRFYYFRRILTATGLYYCVCSVLNNWFVFPFAMQGHSMTLGKTFLILACLQRTPVDACQNVRTVQCSILVRFRRPGGTLDLIQCVRVGGGCVQLPPLSSTPLVCAVRNERHG